MSAYKYNIQFVGFTATITVQLSSGQYTALESSGIVCVTVVADRPAREPFSVFLMPMSVLQQQYASSELISSTTGP